MEKMMCTITHQGAASRPSIRVRVPDRILYFSPRNRNIIIEIDGTKFYTKLTNDFFGNVGQIRTLYTEPDKVTFNVLVEWVEKNNLKSGDHVHLEVIEKNKHFRLTKS